ncbi:MAG: CDP-diacylglycerol--serine O-phosphatidyltransferase [Gammaproteobacteria bacterium]|nr:CDP-diacylglycerol--serine O-phosphatidyltransferase [Gammaproteobacteria bacterium]
MEKKIHSNLSVVPEAEVEHRADDHALKKRGIYLLPNLITTGALFSGFYAVVAGMNGQRIGASLAIFVAMALDTADGLVARRTKTESQFGAQYDSLSDMVAFGVAPALVAFSSGLSGELGRIGWVITFIYMACAALRLARFNVTTDLQRKSFTGLPSPSAAALVACTILVWSDSYDLYSGFFPAIGLGIVTLIAGLLMVSNFKYFSPKSINLRDRVPFVTIIFAMLIFSILLIDPPKVLLAVAICYALSGPLGFCISYIHKSHRSV